MNQRDLRLLDFYKALREFTIGGMLQDVSAENWDQEVREDNEANKFAPYRSRIFKIIFSYLKIFGICIFSFQFWFFTLFFLHEISYCLKKLIFSILQYF